MCYLLYQACCERLDIAPTDFAEAHKISNTAQPMRKMPFGKHKGKLIKDVPISYAKWMLASIHNLQPSLYSALTKCVEAEASNKIKD
ncbi:putative quorum-sensing-regulated virulence factor [Psychrobacter coccoides]|uniref:putative quorum-sensing-regulated virulence factor n=1 Tax=Psychrobacter coccoides TaxID=2818440 RepID=UPI00311C9429